MLHPLNALTRSGGIPGSQLVATAHVSYLAGTTGCQGYLALPFAARCSNSCSKACP
jgi:hypothetical protein